MENDRLVVLSVANSRKSTDWQRVEMLWSEFVRRLGTPQRTGETIKEYLSLGRGKQGLLKDCGGFVGGALNGPRRKAANVSGRDLVTLDMDNIAAGEAAKVIRKVASLGIAYAVYSTRSHAPWRPRLRVILPLNRTVTADEYEPIARSLAGVIGIELCDPTTFEASRMMFWPSCSKDSEYIYETSPGAFVSADGVLAKYTDWHDVSLWPRVPGEAAKTKSLLAKQADPTAKDGVVGAFCRLYNIFGALEKYLPNAYTPTEHEDRLSYTGGSTVAGAVVYDGGNFLYSHHATDPCSGMLVNSFDLVRLHRFGELDAEARPGTPAGKIPSYQAMCALATKDDAVMTELNMSRAAKASEVFQPLAEAEPQQAIVDGGVDAAADVNWMKTAGLSYAEGSGKILRTRDNILKVLLFDPLLAGKIVLDEFAVRGLAVGSLPWDARTEKRLWSDTDDAGLAWYLESKYELVGKDKIDGSLLLASEKNKINEVKDYLDSLVWDGKPRLDTVLVDYLGAEDTPYTRAVARKSFAAAAARVYTPGIKYDSVPVFVGKQGIGKSTFLATIGKDWYSDSLQSFEGKEAAELIQGIWINELGEMTGYNKSEANTVKQFLSKREDIYRQAYGRRTGRYPRKCVFFGTCNQFEFLKDLTGNRRFWPVDVGLHPASKSVWEDLPQEVDQLWAEAAMRYRLGEALYFEDAEIELLAKAEQEKHKEANAKEGLIRSFLEKDVPRDYSRQTLSQRRMFWANGQPAAELVPREKTCALEIWCECFGGDLKYMKRADAMEINQIMENMDGWKRNAGVRAYSYCGKQKGFERCIF